MAVKELRTCDVDETHGDAEQTAFGSGSEFFLADLCPKCRAALDKGLEGYVGVARQIDLRDLLKSNGNASIHIPTVRAWAQANGHNLGDRGRIPADVVEAWKQSVAPKRS